MYGRYYLVPKEEVDLKILSEDWCLGYTTNRWFFTQHGWKAYLELKNKQIDITSFYYVVSKSNKLIELTTFEKMLEYKTIM